MRLFPAAIFSLSAPLDIACATRSSFDLSLSLSREIGIRKPGMRSASIAFEQLVAWRKSDREVRRSRNRFRGKKKKKDREGEPGERRERGISIERAPLRDRSTRGRSIERANEARSITTISPILRIHSRSQHTRLQQPLSFLDLRPIIFAPNFLLASFLHRTVIGATFRWLCRTRNLFRTSKCQLETLKLAFCGETLKFPP